MVQTRKTVIFKRSPVVIVKDFIVIEVVAGILYGVAGFMFYYAQFYRSLPIANYVSFQIAQALFLISAETVLVLYVFSRWYKESFQISDRQLIHRRGVIWKQKTSIPLSDVNSISYIQGPAGKRLKYGTIRLANSTDTRTLLFKHIPDPQDFVDALMREKDGSRSEQKKDNPAAAFKFSRLDPETLLSAAEHNKLEFKSTFRWDLRANRVNKDLEKAAMKTIAAFLNSQGGHLVIGVDDARTAVGMEYDYGSLNKPDADGFENHFSNIFHKMIGAEFRQFVQLINHRTEDPVKSPSGDHGASKNLCIVAVAPAPRPVYLKSDEDEEFYIRTGNGTTSLKFSQAASYIESRFKKRK